MDGMNNASGSIARSLTKFLTSGAKNLDTVIRSLFNFKTDMEPHLQLSPVERLGSIRNKF